MTENSERGPLIDHLDQIEQRCRQGDLSLQEIFDIFGSDGHFILMSFLILPFLQPIPLPGLSTPFGILIMLVAILAYLRKPPWIPKKWSQKKLSAQTILKIAEGSEKVFEKLTKILHPRMKFLFQDPFRLLNTVLLVINALLLSLPLPIPFSNAFPAWSIAFMLLAYLEEDGIFVLLSYIGSLMCFAYFFALALGLEKGISWIGS